MKPKIDNYYDSIANGYNELHGEEQYKKLKIVQDFLKDDPDIEFTSELLLFDVGCGTGISTMAFPCYCAGLDPAIKLLIQANNTRLESSSSEVPVFTSEPTLPHLGYIRGHAEALPIKDKTCTIVVSLTVVHNFFSIKTGIEEIRRITSQRAVISVLKKSKQYNKIIEIIENNFRVLKSGENDFDFFLYLEPLS